MINGTEIEDSLNDAVSDQKLSEIDIDYIKESIEDQLEDLLGSTSKKNYLKKFNERINYETSPLETKNVCDELYNYIINEISNKFGFSFDFNNRSLVNITKVFYKFFVIEFINNITYFLELYIIENSKDIIKELENSSNAINTKRIDGVDHKNSLILNNISEIVEIIRDSNPDFGDFLFYINKHPDTYSSVEAMMEYDNECLSDTENILTSILDSLINEEDGFSNVYINLMTNLYQRLNIN